MFNRGSVLTLLFFFFVFVFLVFFFQAEDGIRYLVRSRGLGDVYKRQGLNLGVEPPETLRKPVETTEHSTGLVGLGKAPVDNRTLTLSLIHI